MNDNSKFEKLLSLIQSKKEHFAEYHKTTEQILKDLKNEKNTLDLFDIREKLISKINEVNASIYLIVNSLTLDEKNIFSKLIKNSASIADFSDNETYMAIAKASANISTTIKEIKLIDKEIEPLLLKQRKEAQMNIRRVKKELEDRKNISILKSYKV